MRDKKITFVLQKGNKDLLKNIVKHPYMSPLGDNFEFLEVENGKYKKPIDFECLDIKHADPTVGYRINLEGKLIAYCLDTGICDNLLKLSKEADILITEASEIPGESNQEWGHLNPEEAAQIAKDANVKKIVMTHMSAYKYINFDKRKEAEKKAKNIFENSLMAKDDLIIEL